MDQPARPRRKPFLPRRARRRYIKGTTIYRYTLRIGGNSAHYEPAGEDNITDIPDNAKPTQPYTLQDSAVYGRYGGAPSK